MRHSRRNKQEVAGLHRATLPAHIEIRASGNEHVNFISIMGELRILIARRPVLDQAVAVVERDEILGIEAGRLAAPTRS